LLRQQVLVLFNCKAIADAQVFPARRYATIPSEINIGLAATIATHTRGNAYLAGFTLRGLAHFVGRFVEPTVYTDHIA
jgi:hypothetical protein